MRAIFRGWRFCRVTAASRRALALPRVSSSSHRPAFVRGDDLQSRRLALTMASSALNPLAASARDPALQRVPRPISPAKTISVSSGATGFFAVRQLAYERGKHGGDGTFRVACAATMRKGVHFLRCGMKRVPSAPTVSRCGASRIVCLILFFGRSRAMMLRRSILECDDVSPLS